MNKQEHKDLVRLFVAVEIPHTVIIELKRLQKDLFKENILVGVYPKPEAMHMTLKFLGSVDREQIPLIVTALRSVSWSSMHAQLTLLMLFGSIQYPKVIYVYVDCPGLDTFVNKINQALSFWGPTEDRPFVPHLTIVRVKHLYDSDLLLQWLDQAYVNPLPFVIDRFGLKESVLTEQGPVYKSLEEFKANNY